MVNVRSFAVLARRRKPALRSGAKAVYHERGEAYLLPGTWVKGEVPTDTAGLAFSAFGLRISLLLRA